jgi:hypothetical protein
MIDSQDCDPNKSMAKHKEAREKDGIQASLKKKN